MKDIQSPRNVTFVTKFSIYLNTKGEPCLSGILYESNLLNLFIVCNFVI